MADICPPVSGGGPIEPFMTRYLDCETDSISVCLDEAIVIESVVIEGPIDVNILGQPIEVLQRPLDCLTDSVSVCLDEPIEVTGSVTVDGTVIIDGNVTVVSNGSFESKHPGVPGKIVPGSRWHSTGFLSLGGTLSIVSPTPGVNQRVVCDWLDYNAVVAILSLLAGSINPTMRDGVGGTIIWQRAIGLLASIGVGTTYSAEENPVLVSSLGNPLQLQMVATLNILDKSLNFGGYIVEE